MRAPPSLVSLLEDGLIEAVLRPLQSGKEAQIYLVMAGGEHRVAKVYKAANDRTFKNRTEYVEGRGTRNTRDQRAMKRRSSYGRARDEDAWQSTEVEMIHRLREARVRVPQPHAFSEGVLIMELVQGADGAPAPRLGDLRVSPEQAVEIHDALIRDVVRMLCAGVVHGDLSEFNVLIDSNGPVIIDLPQAIDASSNPNAKKLLIRDVENIQRFVTRWVPGRRRKPFAAEMWALYELNELGPDTELTGTFKGAEGKVDTGAVLDMISDAEEDETQRRLGRGQKALPSKSGQPRVVINKEKRPRKKAARKAPPKKQAAAAPPTTRASLNDLIAKAMAPAPPSEKAAGSAAKLRSGDSPGSSRPRRRRDRSEAPAGTGRRESQRSDRSKRRSSSNEERDGGRAATTNSRAERSQRGNQSDEAPRRRRRRRDPEQPDWSRESSTGSSRSPERTRSREERPDSESGRRRRPAGDGDAENAPRRRRRRRGRDGAEPAREESTGGDRSSRRSSSSDRLKPDSSEREGKRSQPSQGRKRGEDAPRRRRGKDSDSSRQPRSTEPREQRPSRPEGSRSDAPRRSEDAPRRRRGKDSDSSRQSRSAEPREQRSPRSEGSRSDAPRRSEGSEQAPAKRRRRRRRRPGEGGGGGGGASSP